MHFAPHRRDASLSPGTRGHNAISAIIIVGAMLAAGLTEGILGQVMGTVAVALAAVNVFGGFLVTRRMLEMFKKKDKKAAAPAEGTPK